jgi:hypothetical protein
MAPDHLGTGRKMIKDSYGDIYDVQTWSTSIRAS